MLDINEAVDWSIDWLVDVLIDIIIPVNNDACVGRDACILSLFSGMLRKSRNWRHRSLPNLFQPKEVLTVSPTTSIVSQSPPTGTSFVCTEVTGLDMDQEATSEITLDDSNGIYSIFLA